MPTLLDRLLPEFDFGHHHATVVTAPPAAVAAAAERYDVSRDASAFVRLLLRLRGFPPRGGSLRAALRAEGFAVLGEDPGTEIVFGIAGRFWALHERANLVPTPDAAAFIAFDRPGCAKAAMSIRFDALPDGGTRLGTETRVRCTDGAARRRFAAYWMVIGPFSAWIRRDLLRSIAAHAA